MNLKRQTFNISCLVLPKKERMTIYGSLSSQNTKHFLIRKYHVPFPRTKAVTYRTQIIVQLSFFKINSLLSATSILSCSPMAYNTTEALDKLACTDYKNFGKSQDRFGRFLWTKNDSNFLDIKLKMFKREDKNAEFRLRQNFTMGKLISISLFDKEIN